MRQGANLKDVDLSHSQLSGCNFKAAKLVGVNLNGAMLAPVEMDGQTIPGAQTSIESLSPHPLL